jgi:cytochrome c556
MRSHHIPIALLLCLAGGCASSAPPSLDPEKMATMRELMDAMIDPNADFLFETIVEIVDETGIIDKTPKTDEEWQEVRRRALILSEASILIASPGRRVAKPGERAEFPEVELHPEQIQKMIDDDRESFIRRAQRLQDAAGLALKAIDARDKAALFDALGTVDKACESCHLHYWYPNDERAREAAKQEGIVD